MIESIQLWSNVALEADLEAKLARSACGDGARPGATRGPRVLALVHQAMYDAYVAVARPAEFAPSRPGLTAVPAGASAGAAVAGAAHGVLTALCPEQRARFDAKLAEAVDPGDPGLQLGRAIAAALLEERATELERAGPGETSLLRGRHRAGFAPGIASCHGARRAA